MQTIYDQSDNVVDIVNAGLKACAEFDSATAVPFEIHTCDLIDPAMAAKKSPHKA